MLRGERVTWDKERDKKPHLNREDAAAILRRVLDLYENHFDEKPNRVVLHKSSRYWPEELDGFRAEVYPHFRCLSIGRGSVVMVLSGFLVFLQGLQNRHQAGLWAKSALVHAACGRLAWLVSVQI